MKIFLNPGHMPGVDPGAVNNELGLKECNIALSISQRVKYYLEAVGYEIKLMQSDNLSGESPSYPNITATANTWNADLFISIHCNSFGDDSPRGTESIVYNLNSDSADLANCINTQIVTSIQSIDKKFPDRGIKERTNLAVLKRTRMPAVLVETAFINNKNDAMLLTKYEDDFAKAIARGISDYYA